MYQEFDSIMMCLYSILKTQAAAHSNTQTHSKTDRQIHSQRLLLKEYIPKKKDTRTNSTKKLMNIKYKTKERKEAV